MKLARELSKRQTGRTLYLLDEPTTGLHFDDVRKLLEVLHRLTDLGNTVIIIEHNLDIVRNADYVLDLGPEGGERGGRIVAHGTPEQVASVAGSHTGNFLARHYAPHQISSNGSGGLSHAGPQPLEIAAPDRPKNARGKFVAPEKKTGVPTARAASAGKEAAGKSESQKTAKKRAPTRRTKTTRAFRPPTPKKRLPRNPRRSWNPWPRNSRRDHACTGFRTSGMRRCLLRSLE
jgi:excinuclease ABC subunit A